MLGLIEIRVEIVLWSLVCLQIAEFTVVGTHPRQVDDRGKRFDNIARGIKRSNEVLRSFRDYRRFLHVQKLLAGGADGIREIRGGEVFDGYCRIQLLRPFDDFSSLPGVL